MAWLEQDRAGGPYQLVFRLGTQRIKRSTRTQDEHEAQEIALRVERRLRLVEQGDLTIPESADPVAFLMGEAEQTPLKLRELPTLKTACEAYLHALPPGAIEENSRRTIQIHLKHLQRLLGESRLVSQITQAALQDYVSRRASQLTATGTLISPETIKKEVATAAGLWKFAQGKGWVKGASPTKGLKYPKGREKPLFQTFAEIEARIARGGLRENEVAELWESLILTREDVEAFLDHVEEQSRHKFLYPMIVAAAHTGARRSELLRSQVTDVDLDSGYLTLREKKRNHHRSTTRRVPLSQRLRTALTNYLDIDHPGGCHTFCLTGRLSRSRNSQDAIRPLSVHQAHDHLQRVLTGKWSHIKGWHVLRHSFASNCAAQGVDQRIIDEWMGHQTEDMVRRYRHFFPSQQRQALGKVFDV